MPCRGLPTVGPTAQHGGADGEQAQPCIVDGVAQRVQQGHRQPARPLGVFHHDQDGALEAQVQKGGGQPFHLEPGPLRAVQPQPERVERGKTQQAAHRFSGQITAAAFGGQGDVPTGFVRRSINQGQKADGDRVEIVGSSQRRQQGLRPAQDAETGDGGAADERGEQTIGGPLRSGQGQDGTNPFLGPVQGMRDVSQRASERDTVRWRPGMIPSDGPWLRHRFPRDVDLTERTSRVGMPEGVERQWQIL
ncbi:hypothetical protein D3093_16980 (plasmid) [Azospirillum argentinense]|uniref:Uncharacterized protein n=1 Tax=Azospirillum argentinense TaxID=2970906 RepID=A0A4D8PEA8_9PROT|nr:hypothetical protein [Azospirillum argentinense]QCN96992.1 hypothetical protein D3093_16980 [Azospirillum argentinense]